ncbi:MAG: T9SS type A sorting domain-containing protein [Flavisolibacter sp.]
MVSWSQASCASPGPLTVSTTCSGTNSDLSTAVNAAPAGSCGGATATTTFGQWFTFTAGASKAKITVSGLGTNLSTATTYVEVLSGTCGSFTPVACQAVLNPLPLTGLTPGATYYVRVYITTAPSGPANKNKFTICVQGSPNDECVGSTVITSNTSCTNTASTLDSTTASSGLPVGCESAGVHYDAWYSFTAGNTTETITLSSLVGISSPEIQLYKGSCGSLTSLACGATSLTASGLTMGSTYFVRVSNVGTKPSGSSFNICAVHPQPPPANDDCSGAVTLTSNATCSNTSGTLISATASSGIPVGCAPAGTLYDVWYKFVATGTVQNVALSGVAADITSPQIQLFSGSCGSLTSLACGTTSLITPGLTVGTTYYIRVSNNGSSPSTTGTFSICVTAPVQATYDISRTYINVTKGSTGGTVNPGDTLEMRAIIDISTKSLDSLSFIDTLYNTKGLRLVPGSISWRTNEGKIYGNGGSAFTDAMDNDQGGYYTNGLDTIIRINIGTGSSGTARGQLSSTSYPRVFGSPCMIMATYRVVVYAPYNTKINFKTGAFTFRDPATTILTNFKFPTNNLMVYQSPGLCPNAVSATNALGAEYNGTFGTPAAPAPLARNRGTTPYIGTGYAYKIFSTAGGPNDYYYGIANNTSSAFTTQTTYAKPDASGFRVFQYWDISGDHTGAANPIKGNPPCDTTKPVSATNPCGYMLVVNSAYRADTAFTYAVNNLCPNTYYELSGWFKNICYKCGADSLGRSATTAGYIPTDINDSAGVRPNIAFDVNGTDYFTTGDIRYTGVTQAGSDSTNQWVKRGFVYLTGPSETSFLLTLRNNAPGGGGNDWALDDINVATCLPNMKYSPSLNPTTCQKNPLTINDTIRSYFNTYQNYKWQRSTDNGSTWSDISGATGTATPVQNGTDWQYITSYTIPSTSTTMSDSGNRYRVVVSSTSGNLGNANCQVTDGISIISLNVLNCGIVLKTDLLSFNGKLANNRSNLYWSTSKENEPIHFTVEKSFDGINFSRIGTVQGNKNATAETNYYSFTDSAGITNDMKYRIGLTNAAGNTRYSRIIQLGNNPEAFTVNVLSNPFGRNLLFEVGVNEDGKIDAVLLNASGTVIKHQTYPAYNGTNNFSLQNAETLPAGIYVLQVQYKDKTLTRKVIKK